VDGAHDRLTSDQRPSTTLGAATMIARRTSKNKVTDLEPRRPTLGEIGDGGAAPDGWRARPAPVDKAPVLVAFPVTMPHRPSRGRDRRDPNVGPILASNESHRRRPTVTPREGGSGVPRAGAVFWFHGLIHQVSMM
jgi:hypothetical protein